VTGPPLCDVPKKKIAADAVRHTWVDLSPSVTDRLGFAFPPGVAAPKTIALTRMTEINDPVIAVTDEPETPRPAAALANLQVIEDVIGPEALESVQRPV
jgi:hypothetical protein